MNAYLNSIFKDHVKANQFSAIIRFGISLLISVLLVRSQHTNLEIGAFEYLLLFMLSLSFFWTYAYSGAILSKLAKEDEVTRQKALSQIFYQLSFIAILMALLGWLLIHYGNFIDPYFISGNLPILISIYIFFLVVNSLPETIYLLRQKAKAVLLYNLTIYSLQLIVVMVAIYLNWSFIYLFYAYLVWQSCRFIYTFLLIRPNPKLNWALQKSWFLFSLPLVVHFILGSGMDFMDGHLVSWYFDDETFLFYKYGAKELPFSLLLVNALTAAMIPVLSKSIKEIGDLKNRISRLIILLFPLSAAFLFLSPILFQMVYGEEFLASALVFNIYILVISSRILVPHVLMYAHQDNKALMYFSGLELVLNLVLSLILLQHYGYIGVALATVVAFLFNRIISVYYCEKKYGIKIGEYLNIKHYSYFMILLLFSFGISFQIFFR